MKSQLDQAVAQNEEDNPWIHTKLGNHLFPIHLRFDFFASSIIVRPSLKPSTSTSSMTRPPDLVAIERIPHIIRYCRSLPILIRNYAQIKFSQAPSFEEPIDSVMRQLRGGIYPGGQAYTIDEDNEATVAHFLNQELRFACHLAGTLVELAGGFNSWPETRSDGREGLPRVVVIDRAYYRVSPEFEGSIGYWDSQKIVFLLECKNRAAFEKHIKDLIRLLNSDSEHVPQYSASGVIRGWLAMLTKVGIRSNLPFVLLN